MNIGASVGQKLVDGLLLGTGTSWGGPTFGLGAVRCVLCFVELGGGESTGSFG